MDFGGKFGPPEADEVKKCAKTYVKKPKMRANAHERYLAGPKMNADRWLIEECKIGWVKDKSG
jgi:hypothetical protein